MSQPVAPVMEEEVVSQPVAPVMEEEVVSRPVAPVMEAEVVSRPVAPVMEEETESRVEVAARAVAASRTESTVSAHAHAHDGSRAEGTGRAEFSLRQAQEDEEDTAPAKVIWGFPIMVGILIGALLGAVPAWIVAKKMSAGDAELTKQSFEKQMNNLKKEMEAVKGESDKMKTTLREQEAAWRKAPDKPSFVKVGTGVMLYWNNEGMMRKYYVYRGKGPAGNMVKVEETPLDANFMYLKTMDPGAWRFSISALTKEGIETDKGESIVLTFPLK